MGEETKGCRVQKETIVVGHEDEKPPPSAFGMDITSGRVFATGVLRRKVQRHPRRMDAICLVRGAGCRRRSFNLPYIRTEG